MTRRVSPPVTSVSLSSTPSQNAPARLAAQRFLTRGRGSGLTRATPVGEATTPWTTRRAACPESAWIESERT